MTVEHDRHRNGRSGNHAMTARAAVGGLLVVTTVGLLLEGIRPPAKVMVLSLLLAMGVIPMGARFLPRNAATHGSPRAPARRRWLLLPSAAAITGAVAAVSGVDALGSWACRSITLKLVAASVTAYMAWVAASRANARFLRQRLPPKGSEGPQEPTPEAGHGGRE